MDVADDHVVVTAARTGRHQIGSRSNIALPVAVRTVCRIDSGRPVLLAALTSHGLHAIHPAAVITRLLTRLRYRLLAAIGQRP